ncbi:MAG: hypothetical protein KDK62_03645 [Chlamydiia bacterium]|nr:hypothetical protein [Chlamydiia bacterium]
MLLKHFMSFFAVFCCLSMGLQASNPEECSKELLLSYFPESFLNKTLKQFNVPEAEWPTINQELAAKDRDVIGIVEQKSSQLNPNPLKDPRERSKAIQIFRETLLEIFTSVMNKHNITDSEKIQAMLDDIQQQKAKRFAECMKEST